ncbi:adenylyltransferase/cytidyltransferase family protein [Bathymodiolus japonicus methanotrophic gill symbiont]|uniref:adenylyltransferase/cytidyltransferase family protein n=1 Tax=Bathymodiolus japonicus methanotrophic gill symbiont TaxID=113269 RepID=UPI001C8E9BF4|nr:adenylyltransferase/cytidyltransferase family protein [Bathymodiolus japonicus methanotrophic gill symbiont]
MVVYTVGTFDLLHVGHLALLEYCDALGDTVAVGVASDEVVKLYKPNIPVIPLAQRIEMLQALRCVDIVLPYHELDYIDVYKQVKADIFVIGEDWGKKPHNQGIEKFLKSQGKEVVQIKYSPRNSSTKIKKVVLSLPLTGERV